MRVWVWGSGSGEPGPSCMPSLPIIHINAHTNAHMHTPPHAHVAQRNMESMLEEPNAISIALAASTADCVHLLLNAVIDEKVKLKARRSLP